MAAHVGQPQRLGILDEHAEDATAVRQVADRAVRLLVDALGDEVLEQLAAVVEHPDRRVAGAGQLLRDVQQPVEHGVRVELLEERAPDVQEPSESGVLHSG